MKEIDIASDELRTQARDAGVEYRKDGSVSKMRAHKGNIPVLPQTKLCPHCPAKFTRTTHLNRHLRTHTGERLHRCDTCDAQFTRSDLLTRHKKTCGDPSHANRTRRRSCQACANSKVKCDLQHPCSKCLARGKDCVFAVRPSRSSVLPPKYDHPSLDPVHDFVSKFSSTPSSLPSPSPLAPPPTPSSASSIHSDHLAHSSFAWSTDSRPEDLPFHSDGPSPSPSEPLSSASDIGPSPPSSAGPVDALYAQSISQPIYPHVYPAHPSPADFRFHHPHSPDSSPYYADSYVSDVGLGVFSGPRHDPPYSSAYHRSRINSAGLNGTWHGEVRGADNAFCEKLYNYSANFGADPTRSCTRISYSGPCFEAPNPGTFCCWNDR